MTQQNKAGRSICVRKTTASASRLSFFFLSLLDLLTLVSLFQFNTSKVGVRDKFPTPFAPFVCNASTQED